jgi:tRNA-specific 2-thiouridylase
MKQTIAVAISGGVDSLMAACLLTEQGHQVIGIHFITGFETDSCFTHDPRAQNQHPILDIGRQLGIPVEIVDIRSEFQGKIVDYFTRTYQRGQTPNPCMRCNPTIKFGIILSLALERGAQNLATGHYAVIKNGPTGTYRLFKGIDRQKDQSYFLARLTGNQLASALFPLGTMKKTDVKKMATQRGLQPVTRSESQDVCFIKDNSYGEFLGAQKGFKPQPGMIEDMNGQVVGQHNGLHLFTIGQRRGINCPAAEPYYVIRLDIKRNRLVVGNKKDLFSSKCKVVEINWIGAAPESPLELHTRIRYRSQEVAATVIPGDRNTAVVRFKEPQAAITPGQGAVFYRGDEILGGGWIEESMAHRA